MTGREAGAPRGGTAGLAPMGWRSLPDGFGMYPKDALFSDVAESELDDAVGASLNSDGYLPVPYRPSLLSVGDDLVLVDAGAGSELAEEWGDPVGEMAASMEAVGVDPADITVVFVSHAHPDHVGGLTVERDGERVPSFPNARHLISGIEHEFWASDQGHDAFPRFAELARLYLHPLDAAGLLEPFDGEPEIVPGVRAVHAPGHTPGHTALALEAGGERGLWVADAVLGDLSLRHVEWSSRLEIDRPASVRTRRALLDRAIDEGAVLDGYHLGGPGRVERSGQGYRLGAIT
jgi:glyoxylase-like metal-dependent hydrolase (beta-lactamase superfamily II)